MDCNACEEALKAYLDLELGDEELAEVEGHLEACEACSAAVTELQALDRLLGKVYGGRKLSHASRSRTSSAIDDSFTG